MAAKKKTQAVAPPQADPRAPLDAATFLSAAQRVLAVLRDDLLTRADESPGVTDALKAQWQVEKEAKRTGDPWEVWRRRVVVQVAAAWVLSLVFARTLEDRGLLERNRIAGPGATDSQEQFRGIAPYLSDRDYLLTVFGELSNLPAGKELFDPAHNPVWKLGPSIGATRALLELFRSPDPEAPAFRFGQADTRFLGDLYQDLDEETQERFALLQTPLFVEAYILDHTLERAIAQLGLNETTLIDPTCGSGHFLLGAFERLIDHRLRIEPGLEVREAARRALDAVYGADINPYAVAIARFRLTLAFLNRTGYARLADAPALPLHVVVADSLLHAPQQAHLGDVTGTSKETWAGREFALEDELTAKDVLLRRYAAVVGNPPYITVKDAVLRERYRDMYPRSAAGTYSLGAPFTERFFLLAKSTGFVGMITAHSFMKNEFGRKLVEEFLPTINLDLVVNATGARFPGHGTPTVLLFGTNQSPLSHNVTVARAVRKEPGIPIDPANGLVWTSIAQHGNELGFENEYISVASVPRTTLNRHPWSLEGGGASELKELLESRAAHRLGEIVELPVGRAARIGMDDVYVLPPDVSARIGGDAWRDLLIGEAVRDWAVGPLDKILFPYDGTDLRVRDDQDPGMLPALRHLWPYRTVLAERATFQGTMGDAGLRWYEYMQYTSSANRTPVSISFAEIATHNHFVLDRGERVFKQTAPIIKLRKEASEGEHLALLAYLNSSTVCFYLRTTSKDKGGSGMGRGIQDEPWEERYQFGSKKVCQLPIPPRWLSLEELGRQMLTLVAERQAHRLSYVHSTVASARVAAMERERSTFQRMVQMQERVDFEVYRLFGLVECVPDFALVNVGTRLFEVELVRNNLETTWFERHGFSRPNASAQAFGGLDVSDEVRLLERPEFKRRWVLWDSPRLAREHATKDMLSRFADRLRTLTEPERVPRESGVAKEDDEDAGVLRKSAAAQAVPFLAALRHTPSGLEKRRRWERIWEFQRAQDRGAQPTAVDLPEHYEKGDYYEPQYWALRGELDVPKERFICYPGCESDEDKEPVYGWAGWNHLQQGVALATLYLKRKHGEAWGKERLVPMLAGLDELLPWIWQWHPDPTPESGGIKPGQYIADFLSAQCRDLGISLDEIRAWRPESKTSGADAAKKTPKLKKSRARAEEETP